MNMVNAKKIVAGFQQKELLLCAIGGSFLFSSVGLLFIPAALYVSRLHAGVRRPLLLAVLVVSACLGVLVLSALGYFAERSVRRKAGGDFRPHLKRSGAFAAGFLCFALAYALLCALLASGCYLVLKGTLSYQQIKLVIDLLTSLLTILVTPVILMELLSFSLSRLPLKRALRAGLSGIRLGYGRLLGITACFFLAGGILTLLFSGMDNLYLQKTLQLLAFTFLGGMGTFAIYKTGISVYGRGGGRK